MRPKPTPIPELASTELVVYDLDVRTQHFEAEFRAVEHGRERRFVLRCTGVQQFTFRFKNPSGEPYELMDVTEVYHEPAADGATLVSLELWVERGWIDVTCAAFDVTELRASAA